MSIRITAKQLREKSACPEGIAWFKKLFPNGLLVGNPGQLYATICKVLPLDSSQQISWLAWAAIYLNPDISTRQGKAVRLALIRSARKVENEIYKVRTLVQAYLDRKL